MPSLSRGAVLIMHERADICQPRQARKGRVGAYHVTKVTYAGARWGHTTTLSGREHTVHTVRHRQCLRAAVDSSSSQTAARTGLCPQADSGRLAPMYRSTPASASNGQTCSEIDLAAAVTPKAFSTPVAGVNEAPSTACLPARTPSCADLPVSPHAAPSPSAAMLTEARR